MAAANAPDALSATALDDWHYVSEGGATIVFSYQGPQHPTFSGTVLRLRKAVHGAPAPAPSIEEEEDDPMVVFQRVVIARLLEPEFLVNLDVVRLDPAWIPAFAARHDVVRPVERRAKDGIDLTRHKAVLATDLVGGAACAVEIKPKWGFLPSPTHLSPVSARIKTQTCRMCMHTHLRQARDEAAAATVGYCPLDLFSGEEGRVRKAVESLWEAWVVSSGTVNNLRIFARGAMLKPDDAAALDAWATELLGAKTGARVDALRQPFVDALLPVLLGTRVLRQLSMLQRTLDALDREGLVALRERASAKQGLSDVNPPEPLLAEWSTFVNEFAESSRRNAAHPDPAELRYYTLAYLLSATFKDCSLIVRLPPPGADAERAVVKVIDLDTKSVRKIKGWEELDEQIVRAYGELNDGLRKKCVDGWARSMDDTAGTGENTN